MKNELNKALFSFGLLWFHSCQGHQQCDVSLKDRVDWGNQAIQTLTEVNGFTSSSGSLKFAPFGSISNPNGTYGSLIFGNYSATFPEPSDEFCQCLTGDESVSPNCNLLESPLASSNKESVCKSSFVLGQQDMVIVISCTPPVAQYFGVQTNLFSKWTDPVETSVHKKKKKHQTPFSRIKSHTSSSLFGVKNEDIPGLYFPEISPYNAMNNMDLNTTSRNGDITASPFNSAYVTISTGDQNSASMAKEALINAGVPEHAINIDPLVSDDTRLWDGSDWREQLPDSMEMVYRINGAMDQIAADVYVLESEFLPIHQAFLLRAPQEISEGNTAHGTFDPLSAPWVPRIVAEAETNYAEDYGNALDQFAIDINTTAKSQGYTLSYYGDVLTAMDFGYYQPSSSSMEEKLKKKIAKQKKEQNIPPPLSSSLSSNFQETVISDDSDVDDVTQCCLNYPHNSDYWTSTIHFSTKDCLYEAYGWKTDELGGWNDYQPALLADTRYTSTEASGPPPTDMNSYYSWSCTGENASGYDAIQMNYWCFDDSCGQCSWNGAAAVAGIPPGCVSNDYYNDDAEDDDDDDTGYEMYTCIDGTPYAVQYSDPECTNAYYNYDLSACEVLETDHPTEEMWTGGVFRENSIIVMLGAMSNALNSSVFHDVYMPIPGTYNTPDLQLDFTESQLKGSGVAFMPQGGDESIYENLFMAQWGRSCLAPIENQQQDDEMIPCYEIGQDIMFDNATFYMLIRHYLDPNTGTGPHMDALPRHRVMVFDKL